jgi:endonuclease/exonuclease/phosphatase family metal-dependent hydrolase
MLRRYAKRGASRRLSAIGAWAFAWLLAFGARADERVVVVGWNVENLFDTEDDPANTGDDGYAPRGWCRWTEARYALKLQHLSDVLYGMRPDIVCLAEVENRRVLEDLAECLQRRHGYGLPAIVHREGGDARGIDVAVMARVAPSATNWFCAVPGQRDVLACDFVFGGRRLTVVMNHWKSQLGKKAESDAIRIAEARSVRAFLDVRLRADPAAAILVAGDFNDSVTSPILTEEAGFSVDRQRVCDDLSGRLLYNLSGGLSDAARCTYYYSPAKQWSAFDSMSVTRSMLDGLKPEGPWRVRCAAYGVYKRPEQCYLSGAPLPFRRVRSKEVGDVYLTGFSDHFPVRAELESAGSKVENSR